VPSLVLWSRRLPGPSRHGRQHHAVREGGHASLARAQSGANENGGRRRVAAPGALFGRFPDYLGPPLVVSVILPRFAPSPKRNHPFATGGPRVRILLPPAGSPCKPDFRGRPLVMRYRAGEYGLALFESKCWRGVSSPPPINRRACRLLHRPVNGTGQPIQIARQVMQPRLDGSRRHFWPPIIRRRLRWRVWY
jgi:hypothetical protein